MSKVIRGILDMYTFCPVCEARLTPRTTAFIQHYNPRRRLTRDKVRCVDCLDKERKAYPIGTAILDGRDW